MPVVTQGRAGTAWILAVPLALLVFLGSVATERARPTEWAVPVEIEGGYGLHSVHRGLVRHSEDVDVESTAGK